MPLQTSIRICLAICFCASAPLAAQHTVTSSSETRTIDCKGQPVKISGNKNDVTLRGDCPRVDVAGAGNTVAVDGTDRIEVTGSANRVTWARALTRKAPQVSSTGLNTVQRAAQSTSPDTTPDGSRGSRNDAKPPSPPAAPAPKSSKPTGGAAPSRSSADEVRVLADNTQDLIDCRGRRVRVMGAGNRLTLRGECPDVAISGDRNTVAIEAAAHIQVTGSDNDVTWTRAAAGSKEPRVDVPGDRNQVRRRAQ